MKRHTLFITFFFASAFWFPEGYIAFPETSDISPAVDKIIHSKDFA